MGYFKMRNLSPSVSVSIADWFRKHGYAVRPELSKQERAQLQECFALMDGDGSGAIDVDELYSAFKILGLHVTKHAVAELLAKVDADGSGEVELPEFIQIMTMTREAEQEAQFWGDKSPRHARGDEAVPLHYLTAAYKRKRVIDNVMDSELRLAYAQSKQNGDASSAGEGYNEPAMDLSATFKSVMQLGAEGGADVDVGTLFRSLAVSHYNPDVTEPMYSPKSSIQREERRQQVADAVKARYSQEQTELQLLLEQRQWMVSQTQTQGSDSCPKHYRHRAVRVQSPVKSRASSRADKAADDASSEDLEVQGSADNRNEDGNQMSLTMVLRRSPDLDIETLGGMGLVSSSNLKGPEEAQIEEESLEHVVSNDSNPHKDVTHLQQLHSKLVPRPRHAAMPYAIHLKDFTPVPWHDGLHMAETAHTNHARSEALNKAQPTPLWHSALHASHESEGAAQAAVTGSSTKGSQQVAAVAQQAKQKKRYVHMCRWYPHIHARDARAAFDLYQPSAKLVLECSRQPVLQPRAAAVSGADDAEPGSSHEDQHQAEGAADVAVDAEAVGCDLAYSAECGESLAMHSCTDATRTSTEPATEPAVDSVIASLGNGQSNPQSAAESAVQSASEAVSESAAEAVAATAADPAADPAADLAADPAQGSYSMQQPGLDADPLLPHKSSSVRFLVALDSCTSSEATVNSAAVSPEPTVALISACVAVPSEVSQEQLGSAVKGKHGMQTVSSVSSSLKSSLKSARSSLSTVGSHGMSHGSMQLGVNFARDDGEGDDDDAHPSMAKSAIARGASDAFPAWLTEGATTTSAVQAESNTAVEANFDIKPVHDKHPEKPSLTQATSQGGQDIKAVHDPGFQKGAAFELSSTLFAQRRTRMIAQPTAVKMHARLCAIGQVAKC